MIIPVGRWLDLQEGYTMDWNVIVDNEWIYSGDFETAEKIATNYWSDPEFYGDCYMIPDDEFYGEEN